MKTKKSITPYQKALDRMEREANRAVAHVEFLKKLYTESKKSKKKLSQVVGG